MKKVLLLLLLFLTVGLAYSQDCDLPTDVKSDIQDLADMTASNLMSCCSSYGGRSLSATVYYDLDNNGRCQTRVSKLTNSLIVTMEVQWYGSLTGTRYWIKGRLTFDLNSGRRSWQKISDSGGFPPGCSKGCIE